MLIMPHEEQPGFAQRRLLRGRSFRRGLDTDDRGWTPLHISARKGNVKEVKRLLDEGMHVNVAAFGPKLQGITPLHLAAEGGHLKVMDVLLEHGANIDARTKGSCGWTPLHLAAKERNKEAVRFLVENGAFLPPDINDSRFNPPVHYFPGLEWAYQELKRLHDNSSSSSEILQLRKLKPAPTLSLCSPSVLCCLASSILLLGLLCSCCFVFH